jgi:hypothetical protein
MTRTTPLCGLFFGHMNSLWLYRKHHASIPDTFDSLVTEIRKTSLLPNIRDDAINAMIGLTQGSVSYAIYTHPFNDFLRMSRQPLTDDFQCVRFMTERFSASFSCQVPLFSAKGSSMPFVEPQKFLNDLVTDRIMWVVLRAHLPRLTALQ